MHRPMHDLFVQTITLNILGKVFNRRHFEIFFHSSKKTGFAFHAILSPLYEMSDPVFLVIKQITINFIYLFIFFFFYVIVCWIIPGSGNSIETLYPRILVLISTQEDSA